MTLLCKCPEIQEYTQLVSVQYIDAMLFYF